MAIWITHVGTLLLNCKNLSKIQIGLYYSTGKYVFKKSYYSFRTVGYYREKCDSYRQKIILQSQQKSGNVILDYKTAWLHSKH